jgi:hypothetical protein
MPKLTMEISEDDAKTVFDVSKIANLHPLLVNVDNKTANLDPLLVEVDKKIANSHRLLENVDKKIASPDDLQLLTDRTRAMEQIKRLYTVIAGFAATAFLINSVAFIRALDSKAGNEPYAILASELVAFFSLLILFLFGAERLLDTKYLQPKSPVPSWYGLTWDVVSLIATVGWFVVLAHLLPTAAQLKPPPDLSSILHDSQKNFMWALVLLYVADTVFV